MTSLRLDRRKRITLLKHEAGRETLLTWVNEKLLCLFPCPLGNRVLQRWPKAGYLAKSKIRKKIKNYNKKRENKCVKSYTSATGVCWLLEKIGKCPGDWVAFATTPSTSHYQRENISIGFKNWMEGNWLTTWHAKQGSEAGGNNKVS